MQRDFEARLASAEAQLTTTQEDLAATKEDADQTKSRLASTEAELAATRQDAARMESRLEATQAQLAAVQEVADQAQSSASEQRFFAVRAAECQVRAALEEYRFLYFRSTVDVYRGGQPSTFLDTDKVWEKYMEDASWNEVCPSFGIHVSSSCARYVLCFQFRCSCHVGSTILLPRC